MGLPQRDTEHHTYGDYVTWPEDVRYELIDGIAYLIAPAPTLEHQDIAGEIFRQLANTLLEKPCRVYERAGVREYWLVHPGDRMVTIYRLGPAGYGKPDVQELAGETPVAALPEVSVRWDELVSRLPAQED
ncbi:MAG: hypothetical protein GVY09_17990 [Gammaproteobacteria bacterium]|jgi:Uma2 family endonuclease|nr:hypothetical protein [Gammaproteobacteria bacterium]